MQDKTIGLVLIIVIVAPGICFGLVYNLYRKYYKHMKVMHNNEWHSLMQKDAAADLIGEWVRWPFGSWDLMVSFYRRKMNYDDETIRTYKTKAIIYCKLFCVSLIVAIAAIILLSKF